MLRLAKTKNGIVRGLPAADPRITSFKGIPFAAPPIGENRWRAPMPCDDWEGELEAYTFAPISMQDTPGLGTDIYCREWHVDPEIPMSEDCLYLNVWTPAKSPNEKLPVVVWFFGGALQWGYTAEMEFDGERVARRGIIVVTVNYRLNVFGFLAHPELTASQPDAPTNFGSLDQQAGLRWVKENIAEFGGNPDNITIAGQSAGGGSVLSQMTYPPNKGLFNKAIVQSAMIWDIYKDAGIIKPRTMEDAEKSGVEFFKLLGVETLSEARKLDAVFIRDKFSEYINGHMDRLMTTVQDDKFCFGNPLSLILNGDYIQVPIMAGNTSDEFLSSMDTKDMKKIEEEASRIFADKAGEFVKLVEKRDGDTSVSGIECAAKAVFETIKQSDKPNDCYYYRFDTDIPGYDNPGNFHSVELWFFFETLAKCWRPFKGKHYDLARMMCNYWCNFIKTGDPNGDDADGSPMPKWEAYSKETECDMIFGTEGPYTTSRDKQSLENFIRDWIIDNKV